MNLSSHEAGHAVVATVLGHPSCAIVTATRGQAVFEVEISNPIYKVAVGLSGKLGEFFYDNPLATAEEAHIFLSQNARFSKTDWQYIDTESVETYWDGFHLAVRLLRQHHIALVHIAKLLDKFGDVNFMEVQQALCPSIAQK